MLRSLDGDAIGSFVGADKFEKTRRNRLRDPALQNPWVFSDSIMAYPNQLPVSFARKAGEEQVWSFAGTSSHIPDSRFCKSQYVT